MTTGEQIVTVATYSQPEIAYIVRGRLEAEGIPATIADDNLVTANWLFSNAIGGVKVQVCAADAERARQIIATPVGVDMEEALSYIEDEVEQPPDICPNCGSENVHYEHYHKHRVFLAWAILRFPLPFLKRRWTCRQCGHQW